MKRLLAIVAAATICLVLASPVAADSAVTVPIHGSVVTRDAMSAPDTCPAGAAWRYTGTGGGEYKYGGAIAGDISCKGSRGNLARSFYIESPKTKRPYPTLF